MEAPLEAEMAHRFPLPLGGRPAAVLAGALLIGAAAGLMVEAPPSRADTSNPLSAVKQNPQLARSLCDQFQQLNKQGQSVMSTTGGLTPGGAAITSGQGVTDNAELVATYVIGLNCPDVK
jgi:hypothetical protein